MPLAAFTGEYFKVDHRNHGMHSPLNKVIISDAASDVLPTELSVALAANETTVSVASTEQFDFFEGALVSAANTGYAFVGSEILSYTSVGVSSLSGVVRGVDGTKETLNHLKDDVINKYEYAGVSLRRINTEHDVTSLLRGIDSYYLKLIEDLAEVVTILPITFLRYLLEKKHWWWKRCTCF